MIFDAFFAADNFFPVELAVRVTKFSSSKNYAFLTSQEIEICAIAGFVEGFLSANTNSS